MKLYPPKRRSRSPCRASSRATRRCARGTQRNDLHYRGYDILEIATLRVRGIAYLLVHEKLPNVRNWSLQAQLASLPACRGP